MSTNTLARVAALPSPWRRRDQEMCGATKPAGAAVRDADRWDGLLVCWDRAGHSMPHSSPSSSGEWVYGDAGCTYPDRLDPTPPGPPMRGEQPVLDLAAL